MIVEFKLHNGKVPYFIDKYLSCKVKGLNSEKENDRYIGTVKKTDDYIPKTLVELTEEQAKKLIKTAKITKTDEKENTVELTDKEKEEKLNEITEEENIDTIKKLEGKLKAGKKLQTKEERLSDVRAKLETIDSK